MITRTSTHLIMPGMCSAHSHAFQRALRGRTQRKATQSGTFWSWRDQMFRLVSRLTPDDVFNISRFAFVELAMSGVTAVGEFHYLHHDVGGAPYPDRLELSRAVIRAADEAGIRLTLIRTAYFRAGFRQELHDGQRRFCDPDVDAVLGDVDALMVHSASRDDTALPLHIALAPHSIRACTRAQVATLSAYAKELEMPVHMHVSEQRREDQECLDEYGLRPAQLLAADGVLDERFTAIHGTHLTPDEITAFGAARAGICVCRTTERDLGDGLPDAGGMMLQGVRLCVGADSHAGPDAFEEARAIELDERARVEKRTTAADADQLLEIATRNGYAAIGQADSADQDQVWLRLDDPALAGADDKMLADAVVFGATPRAVDRVVVGGRIIVDGGRHVRYEQARQGFIDSMNRMDLG